MSAKVFDPSASNHHKYTGSVAALLDMERFSKFNMFEDVPLKVVRVKNVGCFIVEAATPCVAGVNYTVLGMALNGEVFIPGEG